MGDTGPHLEAERLEVLSHLLRRTELAVAQFRMLVEVAAPRDNLRVHGPGRCVDRRLGDRGSGWRRGQQDGHQDGRGGKRGEP